MQSIRILVICGTSGTYCTIATPSSASPFDPSEGAKCLTLPPRSPNLNAYAERWVRSAKEECLRKLILFGEEFLGIARDPLCRIDQITIISKFSLAE